VPGPLLLVRHAQSVWNEAGLWQGWADPPLSETGEQQVEQAASRLAGEPPFELVVSSDLERAWRTAELLAGSLHLVASLTLDPGLREYDVGAWSGHTRDEIEARWPGEIARFGSNEMAPPGGEDRAAFEARVAAAGRRLGQAAESAGASRVLVVAHGGVVRALARAAGQPEHRIGHLAGYWGSQAAGGLFPDRAVNLLDGEEVGDAGEGTAFVDR
jgi:broad specificity phosphatase PhoE